MGRSRYKIFQENDTRIPYFLTCTVVNWIPIFASPAVTQVVLDSLTFLRENERMTVYAYVIMENHLHLIASSNDLTKEVGDFKSYSARQIIDFFKERNARKILEQFHFFRKQHKRDRSYQLWQEGSHPRQIQGVDMMRQKIEYIHNNPVKRGYVDEQTHWRYSSARNYAGLGGLIEVTTEW